MIKRICSAFLFLLTAPLAAGSLTLFNDSPFVLHATILAADGTVLSQMTISPQHQQNWKDSITGATHFSQTPYTVIWSCKEGTEYGVFTNLGPGAWATAQSSVGAKYCKPKKKREEPPSVRDRALNE